ncbi:ribonuclease J [uncultured Dubosiella sp.]|uniref:MBL fold metallo-hydrolase RNA specificity domain-containing protein n=1 Tax=uncultured Dubosiella sp. TaxID=1937011 RepID=UPI00272F984B|nr:ribonuclease J [uncultured Dubosiella sp.]
MNHDTRIFVSVYTQSVYRIQEIIECCIKHNRKFVLYTRELQERIKGLQQIGFQIPDHLLVDTSQIGKIKDVVVLISGQGRPLFTLMSNIANDEVENIDIRPEDLIVIASPIVPGVEKVFKNMENDIYKRGGRLQILDKNVLSMHPSKEDLKMMIFLTRPKYYIPVKGEYRMLCANAMIAEEMGIPPEHILLLDNGQVAQFEDGELVSTKMELQLHDTMIDGKENWDMAGVVLKDREILSTDGVMILAIGVDAKTKKIVNGPDIQSRGLIYLKDSEYITSDVAKIMEETIEENVKNKTYDNLETRQDIRDKVAKYLFKQTAKRPMVLPVILEINQ